MYKIKQYETTTGKILLGKVLEELIDFDKFSYEYDRKNKTMLGKILFHLNALKRRRHFFVNSRWEINSGYYSTCGWAAGQWNNVLFGKEVLRGDKSIATTNNWKFRAQAKGIYLVSSAITIAADSIQNAYLGIFKNGTIWSRAKIIQSRIYDFNDLPPVWLYHTTVDLNTGVDQVFLNIGDEIEIKVYYVSAVTGGGISNIVGNVNVAWVGTAEGIINSPSDNW